MSELLLPTVHEGGAPRLLGCLPRTEPMGRAGTRANPIPDMREIRKPYPRSDWPDLLKLRQTSKLEAHVLGIKDQENEGSCTSNGFSGSAETVRHVCNLKPVTLSAMSLFKQVGRSPNSGSSLPANVRALNEFGCLPVTGTPGYEHTHPATGFRTPLPDGWEDTAMLFRLLEWGEVNDFDMLVSLLLDGFPIPYGYHIGRGGHCIYGADLKYENGVWIIRSPGSWGADHNGDGYHELPEAKVSRGIDTFGAFCLRSMTHPRTRT